MLFLARLTLPRQMITLLVLCAASFLLSTILNVHPRPRAAPELVLKGLVGGVLVVLALLLLNLILIVVSTSYRSALQEMRTQLRGRTAWAMSGSALVAAIGEELLFRAILFSAAARFSPLLAVVFNALLMFAVYFRGRRYLGWTVLKTIECAVYAEIFFVGRSWAMAATSRFTAELLQELLLRSRLTDDTVLGRLRLRRPARTAPTQ